MRAEKFIEAKQYGNTLIRVFEVKEGVNIDIDLLLNTIKEVSGDDYESQFENGLCYDFSGDWYSIDVDKVIDKFTEYKEDEEDESYTLDRVDNCLLILKEFEGFTLLN